MKQTGQNQKKSPHTDAPVKATTPDIQASKTAPLPNTMPDPCPTGARRVWNKSRPKKGIESKSRIAKFNDGGETSYPQRPKLAPGVPRNQATTKGYLPPGAKTGLKRGGSSDLDDGTYPAGAQTSYS